jgi:hypothetical protein
MQRTVLVLKLTTFKMNIVQRTLAKVQKLQHFVDGIFVSKTDPCCRRIRPDSK